MTTTWILVANASTAKLYSAIKAKLLNHTAELQLVSEFEHPEARQKSGDIASDRSGNYHNAISGHGTFVESSEPKEHENEKFSRQLAGELESARVAGKFDELIVVAPPHFHGLLNTHLDGNVNNRITVTINKDYTKADERQLLAYIDNHL